MIQDTVTHVVQNGGDDPLVAVITAAIALVSAILGWIAKGKKDRRTNG